MRNGPASIQTGAILLGNVIVFIKRRCYKAFILYSPRIQCDFTDNWSAVSSFIVSKSNARYAMGLWIGETSKFIT